MTCILAILCIVSSFLVIQCPAQPDEMVLDLRVLNKISSGIWSINDGLRSAIKLLLNLVEAHKDLVASPRPSKETGQLNTESAQVIRKKRPADNDTTDPLDIAALHNTSVRRAFGHRSRHRHHPHHEHDDNHNDNHNINANINSNTNTRIRHRAMPDVDEYLDLIEI